MIPFLLLFIGIFISLGTGLLALQLSRQDMLVYKEHKGAFTSSSYTRLVHGRRMAKIGLVITAIWFAVWAVNYGKDGLN